MCSAAFLRHAFSVMHPASCIRCHTFDPAIAAHSLSSHSAVTTFVNIRRPTREDAHLLTTVLQAYERASKDAEAASANPDLYFNRATVHKYLENYQQARLPATHAHSHRLSRGEHAARHSGDQGGKGRSELFAAHEMH